LLEMAGGSEGNPVSTHGVRKERGPQRSEPEERERIEKTAVRLELIAGGEEKSSARIKRSES